MAELDIRKLGVTLRSTSGTMAYAEEIYDSNKSKFQSDINAELETAINEAKEEAISSSVINGLVTDDKVLSITDKKLAATLSLRYSGGKITLLGKNDNTISDIDVSDFIRDKFVQSAELVETAEPGVTGIEVPYIKLTFNDASAPVRFSVKYLVDVYTGANVKLSNSYSSTTAQAPASGVSVDAAIKNVATRVTTAEGNITNLQGKVTTLEGKTHVDSIGGKTGAITLKGGQSNNGTINLAIDDNKQISATINGLGTAAYKSDTYFLNNVNAEVASGSENFVGLSASTKSGGTQTVSVEIKTQGISNAAPTSIGLAEAFDTKNYIDAEVSKVNTKVTTNTTNISNLTSTVNTVSATAYKTVKGTDGQFVSLAISNNDTAKTQTLSASVTTANVKTGGATNGLATAADVFENCIMSTVVDITEYPDFEDIISITTTPVS